MRNKEKKVQLTIKIDKYLHDKIMKLGERKNINKTAAITEILKSYFEAHEHKNSEILEEIEGVLSISGTTLMPKLVYKQLLQKSEGVIEEEERRGVVRQVRIGDMDYIAFENDFDLSSITIEQLLQKKEIELIKEDIEALGKKLEGLAEKHT